MRISVNKISLIISLLCLFTVKLYSQQHYISGFVTDAKTGEKLIGASVVIDSTLKGVATDNVGYFSLQITIPTILRISYTGYDTEFLPINDDKKLFKIFLLPKSTDLAEVEIVSAQEVVTQQFNISTITSKDIEKLPALTGKPDVIKAAQLLPGIEPMNEATSTIIVRGGNPGENNYLFDNVPIIYVNHLGGFMSVFNPDMINSIDIYKGAFPAKYGGKLSSILDIVQREGDKYKYKGSVSAGVTDVSFTFEGPGGLKNSSFIITGRKTFIDFYYLAISAITKYIDSQDYGIMYGFHDVNAKYSWHPDDKNSFHVNVYEGDDYLNIWQDEEKKLTGKKSYMHFGSTWGNFLVSGSWNRIVNQKMFVSNTISYSQYRLKNKNTLYDETRLDTVDYQVMSRSSVKDFLLQSNWKYSIFKNWNIEFGLHSSLLLNNPNEYTNNFSTVNVLSETIYGNNTNLFFENKIRFLKIVEANVGVRLTNYYTEGYNNFAVEPRLRINAAVSKNHVLNFSYMRVTQSSHLLFTPGSIMNNEVWVPAGADIASSYSDQISLGWKGDFYDGAFSAEVDAYYKTLHNLATYKEGFSTLVGDGNWRDKIVSGGSGNAKGVELFVKKNTGKWTGFMSYCLSDAKRSFDEINDGEEFVFEYNRPHSFSFNLAYKPNNKWSFSALWVCQSGLPYTPVLAVQQVPVINLDNGEVYYENSFVYGERNSAKMKPYHRLDVAAKYTKYGKRGIKVEWTFSVYNAYCQQNPFYYYYAHEGGRYNEWDINQELYLYQLSFFPIIPSFSYKVYL